VIVAESIKEIRAFVAGAREAGREPVGVVPTMGALHEGHYSLIDAARRQCQAVVVSLFVNPTQFGPSEDFRSYPRPIEADLAGCEAHGVDAVFHPPVEVMYPGGAATTVHVSRPAERLCGASRPGHFDGVCTVVAKLFHIVGAEAAYFGQKDYQQTVVVRRMVADLDMPVRIVVCPTVREPDGLAMSSRNAYLSGPERSQAVALVESLRLAGRLVEQGCRQASDVVAAMREHLRRRVPAGRIDYVEIVDPETLEGVETIDAPAVAAVAVRFGSARLIDNMRVDAPARSG